MNSLEVIFQNKRVLAVIVPDKRYRIMVTLIRSDRPRYWNFLCFHCGSKVCELVNVEVYDVTDFYDSQNPQNAGTLKHCKGTLETGGACPYSYFFNFS